MLLATRVVIAVVVIAVVVIAVVVIAVVAFTAHVCFVLNAFSNSDHNRRFDPCDCAIAEFPTNTIRLR
jgi:hypothetical protein